MFICRENTSCPVRSLELYCGENIDLLVAAIGPYLILFDLLTFNEISKSLVFENSIIHGIVSIPDISYLVVYGGKNFALVPITNAVKKLRIISYENQDDLVLNCKLTMEKGKNPSSLILMVGFAHNFIDIYEVSSSKGT